MTGPHHIDDDYRLRVAHTLGSMGGVVLVTAKCGARGKCITEVGRLVLVHDYLWWVPNSAVRIDDDVDSDGDYVAAPSSKRQHARLAKWNEDVLAADYFSDFPAVRFDEALNLVGWCDDDGAREVERTELAAKAKEARRQGKRTAVVALRSVV